MGNIPIIDREVSDGEFRIVELLRKLRPYGKIEIAMNQDGSQFTVTMVNPSRFVILSKEIK